jgi:Flp pilus assembly pilin Flp
VVRKEKKEDFNAVVDRPCSRSGNTMNLMTLKNYLKNDRGATVVEYAVIAAALIAGAFLIYALANWNDTGVAQQAFEAVASKVKDFGRIN